MDKNIPIDISLLIIHYLRNQTARIIWGNSSGEYFDIDEGVRQGGILSPFLFKLYIDSAVEALGELEVGCRLGYTRLNILAYADDVILVADSKESLEGLYSLFVEQWAH